MKIQRSVFDSGNSRTQAMIDGMELEIPSAVHEISKEEAGGLFSEGKISRNALDRNLAIKIKIGEIEKYFRVGDSARTYALSAAHIDRLNDKTESEPVFVTWCAVLALYHALKFPDLESDALVIRYNHTMLPIWTVKQAEKFNEALIKMADRFKIPVEIELLTAGFERTIGIKVELSKTSIEGDTARFALGWDVNTLNESPSLAEYKDSTIVINDMGGQTQDMVKLGLGFGKPESRDSFQSLTDNPFLKMIEDLRNSKLMRYFSHVNELEQFLLATTPSRKYVYQDPISWAKVDLTHIIEPALQTFVKVSVEKALSAFKPVFGENLYFVHMGGVTELLRVYMQEYLIQKLGEEVAKERHIFPEQSRKLNLYGGEVIAKKVAMELDGKIANGDVAYGEQKQETV